MTTYYYLKFLFFLHIWCRIFGHKWEGKFVRQCPRCWRTEKLQYTRHQGRHERYRRIKQVLAGQVPVDYDTRLTMQNNFFNAMTRAAEKLHGQDKQ